MIIGYDASKLDYAHKTGTEHYATILLQHLLKIDTRNQYRLYTRQPLDLSTFAAANIEQQVIASRRLWTQWGLATHVMRQPPDVLFIPAHTMPILHRPSLKCVVTIHDLGYEYLPQYHQFPHKLYLNRTTEFAAKFATHLIAVSNFTKQDLIQKLHVPEDKVTVVYEGVDLIKNRRPTSQKIKEVQQKYGLSEDYILFVGTIQPRKNLVALIEAFARILPQHKGVQLVLAGGNGWLSEPIFQAPQRLGIEDKVIFTGYVDESDKPALYAGAKLTALVSLFEGFGLPMLESMACGTPVISASTSSLPEVVGDAGILVDPTSVEDIAQGLYQGLSDTKLVQKLIDQGYEQVKKFSWDSAAKGTLDVFNKAATS
jgi:glycosyltransferase involved in cell wall biosynthesis